MILKKYILIIIVVCVVFSFCQGYGPHFIDVQVPMHMSYEYENCS